MNIHHQLLNSLLKLDRPLTEILATLNALGWDSPKTFATLKRQHITHILQSYLNNQITKLEVENWANAIESREDIATVNDEKELLEQIIFDLANPFLTTPLTPQLAHHYLTQLENLNILTLA
ncbi:MAG: hypothetical protein ACRC6M_17755 [Microcystaceae cyanobacterium]